MRKIIIITLLALLSIGAKGQFNFNYSVGYAGYDMGDMKEFAEMMYAAGVVSLPNAKLTDNFPAYVTHSFDVNYQQKEHEFGIRFTYMTTGAKIAMSDYSGKYSSKLIANAYRLSALYRLHLYNMDINKHNLSFFIEMSPAAIFTSLETKDRLEVYSVAKNYYPSSTNDSYSINKAGFSAQAMGGARFKLYEHFLFTLSGGYEFDIVKAKVLDTKGTNWSGFRITAGVGYSF